MPSRSPSSSILFLFPGEMPSFNLSLSRSSPPTLFILLGSFGSLMFKIPRFRVMALLIMMSDCDSMLVMTTSMGSILVTNPHLHFARSALLPPKASLSSSPQRTVSPPMRPPLPVPLLRSLCEP